jgi:hypothetical protein
MSPAMASSAFQISPNTPVGSEVPRGIHRQTDRQTGDLTRLLSFLESELIKAWR